MERASKDNVDYFPCGCQGYFELREDGSEKTRLVVLVNPQCKYDGPKIGQQLPYVRFIIKPIESLEE